MADKKGPTITTNRIAMSKALGAAFLNHQVEQLEKSVQGTGPTGNWRERRYQTPQNKFEGGRGSNYGAKPRGPTAGVKLMKKGGGEVLETEKVIGGAKKDQGKVAKDADIVVVDASVLVHGIAQVKKWCREGREEVVIVPLEVLNTLDLLKKGTTTLAQRARTASRILEAQVGTNPRIRVQRDDAFILWDEIPLKDTSAVTGNGSSPEWVRRTICCARWELEHATTDDAKSAAKPKVVLAVVSSTPDATLDTAASSAPIAASPVPLPAPQVNRYEPRSAGILVSQWAAKAGIDLLEVPATPPQGNAPIGNTTKDANLPIGRRSAEHGRRSGEHGRRSPDEERGKRMQIPNGGRGRRNSHMRGSTPPSGGLVERPPAVMAMMEMVAQPSRVVRVLARGEKLDPDP